MEPDPSPWGPLTPEELAAQAADKSGLWMPGMDDRQRYHGEPPLPSLYEFAKDIIGGQGKEPPHMKAICDMLEQGTTPSITPRGLNVNYAGQPIDDVRNLQITTGTPPEFDAWGTTPGYMKQQQPITLETLQQMQAEMKALGPPPPKVVYVDPARKKDYTAAAIIDRMTGEVQQIITDDPDQPAGMAPEELEKAKSFLDQLHAEGKKATIVVDTDKIYIMAQPTIELDFRESASQAFDQAMQSMAIPSWAIDPPIYGPDPRTADLRGLLIRDLEYDDRMPRHFNCRCTIDHIALVPWWHQPRHQRRLRWNSHARRRHAEAQR